MTLDVLASAMCVNRFEMKMIQNRILTDQM